MPPTLPRLHANGTPARTLVKGYEKAWDALEAAFMALRETAPNARDYDGDGDFDRANESHDDRLRRVNAITKELETLIGHCS